MTKAEIIRALEGLKDFTNDAGKSAINSIKGAVETLHEDNPEFNFTPETDRRKPVIHDPPGLLEEEPDPIPETEPEEKKDPWNPTRQPISRPALNQSLNPKKKKKNPGNR
jgi:hypothetical protein